MTALDDLALHISHGEISDEHTKKLMDAVFGERYHNRSPRGTRVAAIPAESGVAFAGWIEESQPQSGVYGGTSLIWFPVRGEAGAPGRALVTLVVGTRGLSPDEHILGRPGHARYLRALSRHLLQIAGARLWVKHDPSDLSQPLPATVREQFAAHDAAIRRYGEYIYAAVEVPADPRTAAQVFGALLDFYAWERDWQVLARFKADVNALKLRLRALLFEPVSEEQVHQLLRQRRFVIVQGPPGTGKSRMAGRILAQYFAGHGMTVQFHPAVTYETFVAGISPAVEGTNLHFRMAPGWLIEAARAAEAGEFLLNIDEVNRADLGRVLGEAIYLFEPREVGGTDARILRLPLPLDDGYTEFRLPDGLFVLGTMNSADRSIAILDLAVRRRFAFVALWPDLSVIERQGLVSATTAFSRLLDVFAQYAPDDALPLRPGHSYFLAGSEAVLRQRMQYELLPLLREYLLEGRLGMLENELRGYMDWLQAEFAIYG